MPLAIRRKKHYINDMLTHVYVCVCVCVCVSVCLSLFRSKLSYSIRKRQEKVASRLRMYLSNRVLAYHMQGRRLNLYYYKKKGKTKQKCS
jgi:uncharacterized membrane protein YbjE (DUF340 family)